MATNRTYSDTNLTYASQHRTQPAAPHSLITFRTSLPDGGPSTLYAPGEAGTRYLNMSETLSGPAVERVSTAPLTESERHSLLAAERRRLVLDVLEQGSTPVELQELAVEVAAREAASGQPDAETVERVSVSLHHVHLPKLAEHGVVDYDPV